MTQIDEVEKPSEESSSRNYAGWVLFTLLILLSMVASAISTAKQVPDRLQGHEYDQEKLKEVLSADSLAMYAGGALGSSMAASHKEFAKSLDDPISGLVIQSDKDVFAAMLYAEMRTYQGNTVPLSHLRLLAKSKLPEDQAFYQIYASPKLTLKEADELIAKLPKQPFVYQAARVQALEKAGDKQAVSRIISPLTSIGLVFMELMALPFMGLSIAIWTVFWRRAAAGTLEPKGLPLDNLTTRQADRLAIRAAQYFAIFIVMDLVVLIVAKVLRLHLNDGELEMAGGILSLLTMYGMQRVPVEGTRILLEAVGLSTKNLAKDIGLGIIGFIAEFPVSLILAEISVMLLRFLPKGTHPASEALEKNHDPRTVIPILIAGCIVAPIWEEVVFRGLLFPGLNKILGGLVPGVLVSSFLFAAAHPQGVTLWLPLAFVGATSCYLTHQSRSLIPGIVMHCLHNATLFVMALLM